MLQVPEGCAPNPDGSKYGDQCLATSDWEVMRESAGVLWPVSMLVSHLQGEAYVTISLVYPMLGRLLQKLADDQGVSLQDERGDKTLYHVPPELLDPDVFEARQLLRDALLSRFYDNVHQSDLEDVGIACLLDPRCSQASCLLACLTGTLHTTGYTSWCLHVVCHS